MKQNKIWLFTLFAMLLSGCSGAQSMAAGDSNTAAQTDEAAGESSTAAQTDEAAGESSTASQTVEAVSKSSVEEIFSDRDYEIGYDDSESAVITLEGDSAQCSSDAVTISGTQITITDEGTYILSGSLEDGEIIVDAEDTDKLQLVFDGAQITSSGPAALYIREADKVFITTAADTENTLSASGESEAMDDSTIDGTVFSKSDLTLNGAGTLTISSSLGHGIVSKDDLKLTSGSYAVTAAGHGLSGNDCVCIAGGTFEITSEKDGIHSDTNVELYGGTYTISAGDDGIHSDAVLNICAGTINISDSYEGLEGLTVDISGGSINLNASDDGINAAGGNDQSGFSGPGGESGQADSFSTTSQGEVLISGGELYISASGDGIDSNGTLTVTGGQTYIDGPDNGGNGALDYASEAVISGGVFVASGSSQMAMNFGSASTQGTMMVTVSTQSAGSQVNLYDENGESLISFTPQKSYDNIIISCPEILEGGVYTLVTGETETEITMDTLVYGQSSGSMPGRGGMEPGQGMEAPGQGMEAPGQGMEAPGQGMQAPGNNQGMEEPSQMEESTEDQEENNMNQESV